MLNKVVGSVMDIQNGLGIKFVGKANIFHKNKYTYPKQTFINTNVKHKIICPVHGEFMQSIYHHLRGGCNQCAIEYRNNKQRDTKEEFIEKANLLFGEKYNYSGVEFLILHEY